MWIATIRSPSGEPTEYILKSGKTSIGRNADNDIVINNPSASRKHAEITYDPATNITVIQDLGSTNGTFVNRDRLTSLHQIRTEDIIRIGEHIIVMTMKETDVILGERQARTSTQFLTKDFLLESLDRQAVLLYEVATRLNTVMNLDTALKEVANLMQTAMGVDSCEVLLAEQFEELPKLGYATSIAHQAIDQHSAVMINDAQSDPKFGQTAALHNIRMVMCVPVISEDQVLALIYTHKVRPSAKPFDQGDLQLAAAISHQAALTIQRMRLLNRVRQEQLISQLLKRFLSPQEAEFLLQGYLDTGRLPDLDERYLTILAIDIRDSSGLAERLGACRFGEILARYYKEMTDAVFQFGGMVNRYLGDGMMAVFGMTQKQTDPEESAIRAALEMRDRLKWISQDAGETIEVGIGINTGSAVAGYLGTDEHVEFTLLGDTVNVVWGIESLARPNRVLIGERTCGAVVGKFRIIPLGLTEIKKRLNPIRLYEVMGERSY